MTLNAIFRWKHPDSTQSMNQRLQTLVPRGIFDGGDVTAGGGLTVNVSPFSAIGYDGMLVYDDAVQTLTVAAGQTNYILVRAKYVTGSAPTVQWEVKTQLAYNTDSDKDYLIVFAVVTLGSGAVSVTSSDISFLDRDAVDPMQRHPFRGIVADPTLLPSHPPEQNHDGDLYFVLASGGGLPGQTIYFWDAAGSSWETLATGSYNVETTSMDDVVVQGERNRIEQGSGILGGVRPADAFASEIDLTLIETPSVADQIGIDTFSALVNGHYAQPYARYVSMPAKPGVGTRYDLIFLEVWREAIIVPETYDFERNPDGTLTYTISQISDKVEQIVWQAGIGGDNFDVNELQADDHDFVVTKYRLSTIQNVTTQSLYDNEVAAPLATNIDSNVFAANPGSGVDPRVWMATSTTASDGYSWAIPLYVVKRTAAEDHTIGQAIKEFRDNVRYVFPVYALADQNASRLDIDTTLRTEDSGYKLFHPPYEKASGFLDSLDFTITNGIAANSIQFYQSLCRVRIRGLEDHFSHPSSYVALGSPPATGYERVLVYLKMSMTLYANSSFYSTSMISTKHRPYFPSDSTGLGDLKGQGYKRGYVTYEVVVHNLGAASTELDENDAMTAAGWTKGDGAPLPSSKRHKDGGIWSKSVAIDVDDRIHPFELEWAIPVTLVHRRNAAAWDYNTNPNGTGSTRPDDRTDATIIHTDDLVDLRRLVDVDSARLKDMMAQDIDRAMQGTLRTRMAEKWAGVGAGSGTAGSRLLQSDFASVAGTTGWPLPAPNGTRKIWSDAREFVPVAESFDMDPAAGTYTGTYVTCNRGTGAITITAPIGSHLCRHLPGVYLVDGDSTSATYLQYESDPLWSTRKYFDVYSAPWPSPVEAKVIKGATDLEQTIIYTNTGWTISASDAYGHATSMQNTIDYTTPYIAGDKCIVSFWVHYDRSLTGAYASNYGLAEIPDEVNSVVKGPNGGTPADVHVGTLYTIVRKSVSGASTVSVTSADVAAVSGLSGTHILIGVDWQSTSVKYSSSISPQTLDQIDLNSAQTQMDFTWSGNITAEVEFTIFFRTSDVDTWVEVGKGGKSVRGFYTWGYTKRHDWGGAPASALAFDIGTTIWHDAEVADRFVQMPQIWTSTVGVTGPWTLWQGPSSNTFSAGYQYSNMVSITDPSAATPPMTDRYFMFVYPKWDAPASSVTDELLINYTYTPYQGLSSTGGAKATPATALALLKNMVHGTIEENSDFYVTQSGACSLFGGVDGWTGWPARRGDVFLNFLASWFGAYNQTQMVKSTKAKGLMDLGHNADGHALIPAAIQRLPFPHDKSMVLLSYHNGTADFDIDPGREGVNAGFFSYAPGYPSIYTTYASGVAPGILYDQFVNGVSRLAIPGEPKLQSQARLVPSCAYQPDLTGTNNDSLYDITNTSGWVFLASEKARLDIPIDVLSGHVISRTMTALDGFTIAGGADSLVGSGLVIVHPLADYRKTAPTSDADGDYNVQSLPDWLITPSIETLPGGLETTITTAPVFMCTAPGIIYAYYNYAQQSTAAVGRVAWNSNIVTFTRKVMHTLATIESVRQSYNSPTVVQAQAATEPTGPGYVFGSQTDLIKIPFGANSLPVYPYYASYMSGNSTSLRGRVIAYPSSWTATTITNVEAHIQASEIFHANYGRGIYLGSSTTRRLMPVLVPGTGTPLRTVISNAALPQVTAQPPEAFPIAPTSSAFATTERRWALFDHGGPVAYSFYGLMINPSSDDYNGQIVLQLSGGPTMNYSSDIRLNFSSDLPDGTALDAFWPTGRPIIRNT